METLARDELGHDVGQWVEVCVVLGALTVVVIAAVAAALVQANM